MLLMLPSDLERFVAAELASGRYSSAEEVIREALGVLEDRDAHRSPETAAFERELERRLARMDAGELIDPADVKAKLVRMSEERRRRPA